MKINIEEIRTVFTTEVIKREVMEGDKAEEARKKIARAASKALRKTTDKESATDDSLAAAGGLDDGTPESDIKP